MKKHPLDIPILAIAFRPFFLLTGLYGVVVVLAWMSYLFGGLPLPLGWSALHWHSHEMILGLSSAAIAGFILTAMCNWTGAKPLRNLGLLALLLIWLAGRIPMWTAHWLPTGTAAVADMLFLPCLAAYVLYVLVQHGNTRNLVLVAIIALLCIANAMMHGGFISQQTAWLLRGELLAMNLITLMMIVIGGRIIPLFTANWLRSHGGSAEAVRTSNTFDRATIIVTALVIPVDLFATGTFATGTFSTDQVGIYWPALSGIVALAAAGLNAARLIGWSGWQARREPLLWILHIAYAWIAVALLLKGLAAFALIPASVWQHAWGIGGMATLVLAVMTRVALGHSGRPMTLPKFGIIIYLAISLAAVSRVLAALQWLDYRTGLFLAAAGWLVAFAAFTLIYWPILSRPRADGRPG